MGRTVMGLAIDNHRLILTDALAFQHVQKIPCGFKSQVVLFIHRFGPFHVDFITQVHALVFTPLGHGPFLVLFKALAVRFVHKKVKPVVIGALLVLKGGRAQRVQGDGGDDPETADLMIRICLAIALALFIATIKGSLVACFFMHLISEKKLIIWVLILTVAFFFVLLLVPMWTSMSDQVVS